MKTIIVSVIACLMIGVFCQGCKKEKDYALNTNLRISPGNPSDRDEILIIEKDASSCETLSVVVTAENRIEYTRRYSSMLLMPCHMYTDTVSIGHLQAGDYTFLYTLIDVAMQTSDSIVERSTFGFNVRGK